MTNTQTTPIPADALRSTQILALALTASPLVIAAATYFILSAYEGGWGHPEYLLIVVAVFAGAHFVAERIGYAAEPIERRNVYKVTSLHMDWQQKMILRMAILEAPLMVAIAAAFSVDAGGLTIVIPSAVLCAALSYYHLVPHRVSIEKYQAALNTEGADVALTEMFGLDPVTDATRWDSSGYNQAVAN